MRKWIAEHILRVPVKRENSYFEEVLEQVAKAVEKEKRIEEYLVLPQEKLYTEAGELTITKTLHRG